jgi:hypothetical protein
MMFCAKDELVRRKDETRRIGRLRMRYPRTSFIIDRSGERRKSYPTVFPFFQA